MARLPPSETKGGDLTWTPTTSSLESSIRGLIARAQNLPTGPDRAREARILIQRLACLQEQARGRVSEEIFRRLEELQRQITSSMFDSHRTPDVPGPAGRQAGRATLEVVNLALRECQGSRRIST